MVACLHTVTADILELCGAKFIYHFVQKLSKSVTIAKVIEKNLLPPLL